MAIDPAVIEALSDLAWPLIVGVLLRRLYPFARDMLQSRAFTVEVGQFKLSVQDATSALAREVNELRDELVRVQADDD